MNTLLDGGATSFNFPFWKVNDMQDQDPQSVNEGGTLSADSITAGKQVARRLFFEKAWGKNDLVDVQAGSDPVEAVLSHLGKYWDRQYQKIMFYSIQGVIADNVANDSSDMVEDITGATTTTINSNDIIDAIGKFGDADQDVVAIAMHSTTHNTLRKANLIDFTPTNEQNIGWGTYLGKTIIVDDMLLVSSTYWTVIFKSSAFMTGFSAEGYVQAETDRVPSVSGGQTIFYTRRVLAMHPAGFAWVEGSLPRTYPEYGDLAAAAHWNRVVSSVKNVGFSILKSTG
ncbi:MAG: major capsid protein [Candidatus Hodarchaeota archaeon]